MPRAQQRGSRPEYVAGPFAEVGALGRAGRGGGRTAGVRPRTYTSLKDSAVRYQETCQRPRQDLRSPLRSWSAFRGGRDKGAADDDFLEALDSEEQEM